MLIELCTKSRCVVVRDQETPRGENDKKLIINRMKLVAVRPHLIYCSAFYFIYVDDLAFAAQSRNFKVLEDVLTGILKWLDVYYTQCAKCKLDEDGSMHFPS